MRSQIQQRAGPSFTRSAYSRADRAKVSDARAVLSPGAHCGLDLGTKNEQIGCGAAEDVAQGREDLDVDALRGLHHQPIDLLTRQ